MPLYISQRAVDVTILRCYNINILKSKLKPVGLLFTQTFDLKPVLFIQTFDLKPVLFTQTLDPKNNTQTFDLTPVVFTQTFDRP